jgi:hypothetical protein
MAKKPPTTEAAALTKTIDRVTKEAELDEPVRNSADHVRAQLQVSAGVATPLEDVERAVTSVLSNLQRFETKVRDLERSGKTSFAAHFPGMPQVPSSREIALLRKRLTDDFFSYGKARG